MAEYAIYEQSDNGLSHLLLTSTTTSFSETSFDPLVGDYTFRHPRSIYDSTLIANAQMEAERGTLLIAEGLANPVALSRTFFASPDLVQRLKIGM